MATYTPLEEARARRRLTQEQLAELADVSPSSIIRAEHGQRLHLITQIKIAEALGLDREDVFPDGEEASA